MWREQGYRRSTALMRGSTSDWMGKLSIMVVIVVVVVVVVVVGGGGGGGGGGV